MLQSLPLAPHDHRSAEILASVRSAFAAKGFDGASMQDLARAAGMSVGNFYRYFPSKAAIVEDLVMEFDEGPADPAPGLAQLRSLQRSIEDALVPIMTGVVKVLALMD